MIQVCNKPPRYKCGYCDQESYLSAVIKNHSVRKHKNMQIKVIELYDPHAETRSYACPNQGCSKRYKHKRDLTIHVEYECGKTPRFKCFYCNYKSCFKNRTKMHYKLQHPDKPIYPELDN